MLYVDEMRIQWKLLTSHRRELYSYCNLSHISLSLYRFIYYFPHKHPHTHTFSIAIASLNAQSPLHTQANFSIVLLRVLRNHSPSLANSLKLDIDFHDGEHVQMPSAEGSYFPVLRTHPQTLTYNIHSWSHLSSRIYHLPIFPDKSLQLFRTYLIM